MYIERWWLLPPLSNLTGERTTDGVRAENEILMLMCLFERGKSSTIKTTDEHLGIEYCPADSLGPH